MTAQIDDTVFHNKIGYSIAGISGTGLFEPQTYGIEPVSWSTACWRGYHVQYEIDDDRLLLTKVALGLSEAAEASAKKGEGPILFGETPVHREKDCEWVYTLREPVPFTGGLLLADEFIPELYVHMGFHPAWKYRRVREVILEQGVITEDFDRSAEMEDFRSQLAEQPLEPGLKDDRLRIEKWIEQCFSRNY